MAAEEKQNLPEAEQQGSPEEQSMEASSGSDGSHDQEKRKEAKVCPLFTNPHVGFYFFFVVWFCPFCAAEQEPESV